MKRKIFLLLIISILLCCGVFVVCATKGTERATVDFIDISEENWFYEDVLYATSNGLMNGIDETTFLPHGLTTRGMIVTILWRLDGEPSVEGDVFTDVSETVYYSDAVYWAFNNQIVNGYDADTFAPDDIATREQITAIMYRYAAYKKADLTKQASLAQYDDAADVGGYAKESFAWACANGIVSGITNSTLAPKEFTSRCQLAAILKRFCVNVLAVKEEEKQTEKLKDVVAGGTGGSMALVDTSSKPSERKQPTILVGKGSGTAGETVQLAVTIKNNPGVLGMELMLSFDESKCILESVENGSTLRGVLGLTTSKTLRSGMKFLWDGLEVSQDAIQDGEILLLNFKIREDAIKGSCPISIQYESGDVVDNDLQEVELQIKNGVITVH